MYVGMCFTAFALEVFTADKTTVDVERAQGHTALLMEIEIEHVPPYLA